MFLEVDMLAVINLGLEMAPDTRFRDGVHVAVGQRDGPSGDGRPTTGWDRSRYASERRLERRSAHASRFRPATHPVRFLSELTALTGRR